MTFQYIIVFNGDEQEIKRFFVTSDITKKEIGDKIQAFFRSNACFTHYRLEPTTRTL